MSRIFFLLIVIALMKDTTLCVKDTYGKDDVVVKDLKIFVEGKEFFMRGVAYQPEPLGISKMPSDGYGGAGLCSPKMSSHGEWKSACWDSDYFDGSNDPERGDKGPDQWFRQVWERDFPIMQEVGVNTIRLYNVNPTTRKASIEFLQEGWNAITKPYGKDHVPFLDYAHEMGFKVIFPLVSDESALTLDSKELIEQKTKNIIDEVGNHPAVVMWVIGNELSLEDPAKAKLLQTINDLADLARSYTLTKFNRILPVTHCVADLPTSYEFLANNLNMEVFCANAGYRSNSLTNLYSGDSTNGFSGWKVLSEQTNKPLLIGEIGWLSINNTANIENPNWFNGVWKDIMDNNKDGCIGGIYFEYSDEKYKQSGPDQTQLGLVKLIPYEQDGKSSENDVDFFYADIAVKKEIIFESVKNGTWKGESVNFNTDIFEYLGRDAETIDLSGPVPIDSNIPSVPPAHQNYPSTPVHLNLPSTPVHQDHPNIPEQPFPTFPITPSFSSSKSKFNNTAVHLATILLFVILMRFE